MPVPCLNKLGNKELVCAALVAVVAVPKAFTAGANNLANVEPAGTNELAAA